MIRHYFSQSVTVFLILLVGCGVYVYNMIQTPPETFPKNKTFTVYENESLRSLSGRLEDEQYITSALLFRAWISFYNRDRNIQLGEYIFPNEVALGSVVKKFALLGADFPLLSVTIPEGSQSSQVALLFAKVLPDITLRSFIEKIEHVGAEGMLFPSTYFLLPSYKEGDIVDLMKKTFHEKTDDVFKKNAITLPLVTQHDVLVLASILEGEAKTEKDMRMVSGILRARLTIGMPLQVDVARETYKQKGLPKEPINNPGIVAINAALNPETSPYLFYLTGNDGMMYYAKTFAEHKRNIQKYLR